METIYKKLIERIQSQDSSFETIRAIADSVGPENFFLAGGIVRDAFLDHLDRSKDADLFVTASAIEKIIDYCRTNGRLTLNQYGSTRWFPFSTDSFYYDIIVIEEFYHGLWRCKSIVDVLNQFDVTINAVAFDLKTMKFYDPIDGIRHLRAQTIRAVRFDFPEMMVSSKIQISRNSVLWFRYNYYARKIDFTIEPVTLKWINENAFRTRDLGLFKTHFFDPFLV